MRGRAFDEAVVAVVAMAHPDRGAAHYRGGIRAEIGPASGEWRACGGQARGGSGAKPLFRLAQNHANAYNPRLFPSPAPMANTAQARKRARQSELRRKHNAALKSTLRTAIKNVKKAIAVGDKAAATRTLQASTAIVDRIADKRIIHKNKAGRHKSRLAAQIRALA